jgi:hypothetical protein
MTIMIPTPQTITAEWLGEQLRRAGHANVEVGGFRSTPIGTGQIGKCIRFDLQLQGEPGKAPTSLIGKFPSDDPASRSTGVALRNYYREVRFYQRLAHELQISTPRCYYAEIDGEGPEFALLLEDLSPAVQGDQLSGCAPAVAAAALRELVGLQAPTWRDERFKSLDWLHDAAAGKAGAGIELYRQMLPGFIDRYGSRLDAAQVDIIARVAESPGCPLFAPLGDPFCLEHVDYRLDNMLINEADAEPRVTVVDWQSVKVGKPLNDVAYFIGAGLLPATRRPVEEELVRGYHRQLRAAGIEDFHWADCWEAYRRGSFAGFGVTVIAAMLVQQTPRGDEMFTTMADRHSRHALDLGAREFLR